MIHFFPLVLQFQSSGTYCIAFLCTSHPNTCLTVTSITFWSTLVVSIQDYQQSNQAASSQFSLNYLQPLPPVAWVYHDAVCDCSVPTQYSDALSPKTQPYIVSATCWTRWLLNIEVSAGYESCTARDGGALNRQRLKSHIWLVMVMSCTARHHNVSYGWRWLLTLTWADCIQPYMCFQTHWHCGRLR